MKKFKQLYPIVLIVWEDIELQDGGWIKHGHVDVTPCLMTSVGYLIHNDDNYLIYASDLAEDGTTNGRTQVPKGLVKSVKVLRDIPKPRTKRKVKNATRATE